MRNFSWKWKLFWGNCYTIYDDNKIINKILIYHKKIFILNNK